MTTTFSLKLVTKVISSILESNTHLDSYEAYWGVLCGVHVLQHKMSSEWDTPKQEEEVHSMIHKLSGVSVWSTYETILLCSEVPQGQKGLEINYKSKKKIIVCDPDKDKIHRIHQNCLNKYWLVLDQPLAQIKVKMFLNLKTSDMGRSHPENDKIILS